MNGKSGARKAGRRRLDPATRTEMILEAALHLFAERHYSIVTMRDVAEACGVNAALIFYYFESKDQLFRRTIGHVLDRMIEGHQARQAGTHGPAEGIAAWLDMHVSMMETIGRMVKIMADYAASSARDTATDALIAGFYALEQDMLETFIRRGILAGRFAAVDAAKTARTISLHLDGIFHASASRGDDRIAADIDDLRELIATLLSNRTVFSPPIASTGP